MFRHCCSIMLIALSAAVSHAQPARETLISSSKNVNLSTVLFDSKDLAPECPTPWSVQLKLQRGGKQEGVQLLTLDNGKMQIVLIPTRGMGILHVTMGDLKLGWNSPVTEVVHPKHINLNLRGGLGWLEGFNEWLARCGLENTGQAGVDEIINNVGDKTTVDLTLHGKIANIPASEVEIIVQKTSPYRITIRGIMYEKMLFEQNSNWSPKSRPSPAPRNSASRTRSSTRARSRKSIRSCITTTSANRCWAKERGCTCRCRR